jgi:recombination protein RecA
MTISPDKAKAVDSAMGQIERQFGKGAIMKLGARPIENIPVISTGSIELDRALGIGGLPRGRVIEIFGPESSGKTTLALHAVAQCTKTGRHCRVYRCRTCPGHRLCAQTGRQL